MFRSLRCLFPSGLFCLLSGLAHAEPSGFDYLVEGNVIGATGLPLANKDLIISGAGLPYPRLVRTDGGGNFKTSLSIYIPCFSGLSVKSIDSLRRLVAKCNDSLLYVSCEGLSAVVPSGWWNHWPRRARAHDLYVERLTFSLADKPLPPKNQKAAWEREFEKIRAAIQARCSTPGDSAELRWSYSSALELIEPRNRTLTEFRTLLAQFGCLGFLKILTTEKANEYKMYMPGRGEYPERFLTVNSRGMITEVVVR